MSKLSRVKQRSPARHMRVDFSHGMPAKKVGEQYLLSTEVELHLWNAFET